MTSTLISRRACVGVGMIAPVPADNEWCRCPMCDRLVHVRNDGTVGGHRMDYARWVEAMAQVVHEDRLARGLWPY